MLSSHRDKLDTDVVTPKAAAQTPTHCLGASEKSRVPRGRLPGATTALQDPTPPSAGPF